MTLMRGTIHLVTAGLPRPAAGHPACARADPLDRAAPSGSGSAAPTSEEIVAPGRALLDEAPRTRAAARRSLRSVGRTRCGGDGLRGHLPPPSRPDPAARALEPQRTRNARHRRVLARPPARRDAAPDQAVLRYLARVRACERKGRGRPGRASPVSARWSSACAAASARSATSTVSSSSTCRTRRSPTRTRPPRSASCRNTTTSSSPTPTARGSATRTTGRDSASATTASSSSS